MVEKTKTDDDTGNQDPPEVDDDAQNDDGDEGDPPDDAPKQTENEKKLAEALKKARQERNDARKALADARKASEKPADGDKAAEKAADDRVAKLEASLVRKGAITELVSAGLDKPAAEKAVKLLDLTDVGPDDDLSDAIDELKDDFPELFAGKSGPGGRAPAVKTGSERGDSGSKAKTPEQRFADRLMKSGGYR
jgi:hypothetical protein